MGATAHGAARRGPRGVVLPRRFRPGEHRLHCGHWIPDLRLMWAERVEDMMNRGVIAVEPDDSVVVAVDTMIETRARSLPVVERRAEGPVLVGVVSRTNVLSCLISEPDGAR